MLRLNNEQMKFLSDEFGITKEKLENISKDEWHKIRESCFDASVDELLDDHGNAVDFVTKRCDLAESIADIKYSQLFM